MFQNIEKANIQREKKCEHTFFIIKCIALIVKRIFFEKKAKQ